MQSEMSHVIKMRKIIGLFKLTRPMNSIIIGLSVMIGAIIGSHRLLLNTNVLLLIISVVFISSAGHMINDVADVDIDAINKPYRPIPSGVITSEEARVFSFVLFGLGVFISAFVSLLSLAISITASVLLYLYATNLKRSGFLGNLSVALLAFLTFVYGGTATKFTSLILFPGYFAFILTLGREILKDIEDVRGDVTKNIHTIAVEYGIKPAMGLVTGLLGLLVITSEIPFLLGYMSTAYLVIAAFGVDVPVIISLYLMYESRASTITTARRLTKYAMLFGVLAFVIDALT